MYSLSNYKEYALEIRKAERLFLEASYEASIEHYVKTLKKYDFPYLDETLQATYVSTYIGNIDRFTDLIEKCIDLGLTNYE
jgi:hypothetical protein